MAGVNTLQIAVNTRIKLMYRPASVKGKPEAVADQLEWHREGNDLVVNNPTPFYMNFQSVTLNGHKSIKRPGRTKNRNPFCVACTYRRSTVSWSIITDYGSISKRSLHPCINTVPITHLMITYLQPKKQLPSVYRMLTLLTLLCGLSGRGFSQSNAGG